jgi:putative FmdB family regulatory protein
MPLYEYRCAACEERFEVLQRMGEGADGLFCPSCGAENPEKLLSTFATASGGRSTAAAAPAGGCGAPACGSGFS